MDPQKKILILGAGTAGIIMANHLAKNISRDWEITIVDKTETHCYQPGLLFIPFGIYSEKQILKPTLNLLPKRVNWIRSNAKKILPEQKKVELENGSSLNYSILILATGNKIVPEETEGLLGDTWRKNIFDFYTLEGSLALRSALNDFRSGNLVVHISEMPIKCPVAPLEFAFLADSFFRKKNLRKNIEITYVTPLSGAFTKPVASSILGNMLTEKNIKLVSEFNVESIDSQKKCLKSFDDREVPYDLLVTVPVNMGADIIQESGLGNELGYVATDLALLSSRIHKDIFILGDATDIPASKAGSVVHFQSEILAKNIMSYISGKEMTSSFDGHANCFIESGGGKAFLIDFNYDTEPLPGKFPFAWFGPFSLLKNTRINHWGKLFFRWIYWYIMLKAIKIPFIPTKMSLKGKNNIKKGSN